MNSDLKTRTWSKVDKLIPGHVYQQGNINDFIKMTKWGRGSVLYFGDHVFTDLAVSNVFVCVSGGSEGEGWRERERE